MKRALFSFHSSAIWLALIMALSLLTGCATNRTDWQARIGHYTYDQALGELGPPEKSAKQSDGSIVAEWVTQRGQVFLSSGSSMIAPGFNAVNTPEYFLRLIFDPAGKLKSWKNYAR